MGRKSRLKRERRKLASFLTSTSSSVPLVKISKIDSSSQQISLTQPILYLLYDIDYIKSQIVDNFNYLRKDFEEQDKDLVFYGHKFEKNNVGLIINVKYGEFSIIVYPILDGEHMTDIGYPDDEYFGIFQGKPDFPNFQSLKAFVLELIYPIVDKVSFVDWSEAEHFCAKGSGNLKVITDKNLF